MDEPDEIVGRLMSLEYFGLPKDFLQRYRDSVVKLTSADLLRVARRHLHPDRVVILAVGRDDDFEKPLSAFGRINVLTLKPGGMLPELQE